MLVKILIMAAVIINSLLSLSKAVNLFLLIPVKENSGTIALTYLFRLQILNKITLSIYSFHAVNNRLLSTGCVAYHINFRQICLILGAPFAAIRMLPLHTSLRQI